MLGLFTPNTDQPQEVYHGTASICPGFYGAETERGAEEAVSAERLCLVERKSNFRPIQTPDNPCCLDLRNQTRSLSYRINNRNKDGIAEPDKPPLTTFRMELHETGRAVAPY